MDKRQLAKFLDFANHHQTATDEDIKQLCQKVKDYGFNSAFVNPYYVPLAKEALAGSALVGTVVSFPLGQESLEIKKASVVWAVKNGAQELDCCMNFGTFKQGSYDKVREELKTLVYEAKNAQNSTIVKFINEVGLFNDDEIKKASQLIEESGADFVKIGSGFGPRGPTVQDVELVKSVVSDKMRIKVAGGITTYEQVIAYIRVGVQRIGTSHGPQIIDESDIQFTGDKKE